MRLEGTMTHENEHFNGIHIFLSFIIKAEEYSFTNYKNIGHKAGVY